MDTFPPFPWSNRNKNSQQYKDKQQEKTDKIFDKIIKDAVKRGYDINYEDIKTSDFENCAGYTSIKEIDETSRIKRLLPFSSSLSYNINNTRATKDFLLNGSATKRPKTSLSVNLSSSLRKGVRNYSENEAHKLTMVTADTGRCGIDPNIAEFISRGNKGKNIYDIQVNKEADEIDKIFLDNEKLKQSFERKRNAVKDSSSKQLLTQMTRDLEIQSKQSMIISRIRLNSMTPETGIKIDKKQNPMAEGSSIKFCKMQIGIYKNEKEKEEALRHNLAREFMTKKSAGNEIDTYPAEKKKKIVEDMINLYNYHTEDSEQYRLSQVNKFGIYTGENAELDFENKRKDIQLRSKLSIKNKQERIRLALEGPISNDKFSNEQKNSVVSRSVKRSLNDIDGKRENFGLEQEVNDSYALINNDYIEKEKALKKTYTEPRLQEIYNNINENEFIKERKIEYIKQKCELLNEYRNKQLEESNKIAKRTIESNLFDVDYK